MKNCILSSLRQNSYVRSLRAILLCFASTLPFILQAQSAKKAGICRLSPDGVYLLLGEGAVSPQKPFRGVKGYVISRAEGNSDRFKEIAKIERVENLAAFRTVVGDELANQIKQLKKFPTDEALWQYVVDHPSLKDYGMLALDLRLGRAFGVYYLDESPKKAKSGTRFRYQVQMIRADAGEAPKPFEGEITTATPLQAERPRVVKKVERDSVVAITWKTSGKASQDVFFANVYRQIGGRGGFERLESQILVSRQSDSILYHWEEKARPEVLYRFYIQPTDLFGNPGPVSDTASVISVNWSAVPLLANVTAKDTTGGLVLHWQALPAKPYWVGIMVERSRDSRGNYVVIDTLPPTETRYFDRHSLPNMMYYYRLKAVTIHLGQEPPSASVSARWRNELLPPTPPAGLRGAAEGRGVRLTWQANTETDLFAYFVYRGRNLQDSMVAVSPPLQTTTFLDTSRFLSGRTAYVYAIRAVSMSELSSDLSNKVSVKPQLPTMPPAPLGIAGYAEGVRIRLSWSDATQREETVVGYQLYRRLVVAGRAKGEADISKLPASKAAAQYGFDLIANPPAPYYDDTPIQPGQAYQYAVASIDAEGSESTLSSLASIQTEATSLLPPPEISLRATSKGVELSWGTSLQAGITGYAVYRRARSETQARRIGTLAAGQATYVDASAQAGNFYLYSIRALSGRTEGRQSEEKGVRK